MTALGLAEGRAFLRLMKRYVMDYSNSHDQAQTVGIMAPDYALTMGTHRVAGRDTDYFEATRKQMDQFPGLVLTVHEIWTSGARLVMRFSEHGASVRHGGAVAAWSGIGLYDWDGKKLISNFVEQDYASRAEQLSRRVSHPVESPATAPWDGAPQAPDANAEDVVSLWLQTDGPMRTPGVLCDDEWAGAPRIVPLDQASVEINTLFSCGGHVAFHAVQVGTVRAEFAPDAAGLEGRLSIAGLVEVANGAVLGGRIVRNRIDLKRSLSSRSK